MPSDISSNFSNTTFNPATFAGTQEGSIAQKAQTSGSSSDSNIKDIKGYEHLSDNKDQSSDSTHFSDKNQKGDLGSRKSADGNPIADELTSSVNDGGATADAAFKSQFQGAGTEFVNSTTLSQKATDYVSKTIQSKVALSSMTLKMQTLVTKNSSGTPLVNKNGAPPLPEPGAIIEESDASTADAKGTATTDDTSTTTTTTDDTSTTTTTTDGTSTTTTTDDTSTTTTTTDSDSAPLSTEPTQAQDALNVFNMTEQSASISTVVKLQAVSAEVAGANSEENNQLAAIAKEQININKAAEAAQSANTGSHGKGAAAIAGWVVNSVMLAVGVLLIASGVGAGVGAALVIGATLSMIMMSSAGTVITAALVKTLENNALYDIPAKDASIVAAVIEAVVIMALSMGGEASGIGDALSDASMAAKEAVWGASTAAEVTEMSTASAAAVTAAEQVGGDVEAADLSAEEAAANADDASNATNAQKIALIKNEQKASTAAELTENNENDADVDSADMRDADVSEGEKSAITSAIKEQSAMQRAANIAASLKSESSMGRAAEAFGTSLYRSAENAASRTMTSVGKFAKAPVTGAASAAKSAATSTASAVKSVAMLPYNIAKGVTSGMLSCLKGISSFLIETEPRLASSELEPLMTDMATATTWEKLGKAGTALLKALPQDALSSMFVTATLLQSSLKMYESYIEYKASLAMGLYQTYEGDIKYDAAMVSLMESLIENTDTSYSAILNSTTQDLSMAENAIALMTSPLENLAS